MTNTLSRVHGTASELRELDEQTSYPVEDAEFTPAFRNHQWDGREHLLRKSVSNPWHLCPTGALADIEMSTEVEWVDLRRRPGEAVELTWIGPELREYQERAIANALKDRGPFTGMGMLNLPIRSGKTKTVSGLIQRLGLRTLFIVPSEMLLVQTVKNLRECIDECPVGRFGGGHHEMEWITVATAQALLRRPKEAAQLLSQCDILVVDEAHHLEGEAWRKMILRCDAYYKIGLSATIFVSKLKQNLKSSIWLKACTGPIVDRVSMNYLFERGYLLPPQILFYRFQHGPKDRRDKDYQWVVRERLAINRQRNALIAELAEAATLKGMCVLIDTGRSDQLRMIYGFLKARGVAVEQIDGKTKSSRRQAILASFQSGEVRCLIGTVFGEGIDIPELELVINAEGQKTATGAIQRMRNLTPSEGKTAVLFVDIADIGQPTLAKHATARLKLYKGMRGFKVRAIARGSKHDPLAA